MPAQALFAPGYSVVIYYPYNGNSPRRKIPEGIRTFERRYYDLGSLLWFIEAWYWEPRNGDFYLERNHEIHPKAPAIYLVIPPGQGVATDGGSREGDERRHFIILPFILAPILYLLSPVIINVNVKPGNYTIVFDGNDMMNVQAMPTTEDETKRRAT
ncbi:hypothetical protein [Vulcanisaeta distributa]|uniref:Uncharacterized protein n=1 Tax=Vulcanisaeta distributa (strain DSM 14429 / JCM 11212 / NBRC 100878 / IC-017) TaxID=572478 RepID=E1QU88_VULDI|nr:hypothetical protein [Vulcanisaeta distributa]ADN51082.1 hypothetical protein Vdis_1708 [Vulcanisaeta distributa DSM 14429]